MNHYNLNGEGEIDFLETSFRNSSCSCNQMLLQEYFKLMLQIVIKFEQ